MRFDAQDVLIWGAGGHAKVVADILRHREARVIGFIDDLNPERKGESFCGAKVLGTCSAMPGIYRAGARRAFVAIGNNRARLEAARILSDHGFEFVTAIHASSVCHRQELIGLGSLVAAGAIIGPDASVGWHAIVNTAASLDHDCVVGDGSHLGPGAVIAGSSEIGRGASVGAGAVIVNRSRVGDFAVVGAGAVVLNYVPAGAVTAGVPARLLREDQERTASV